MMDRDATVTDMRWARWRFRRGVLHNSRINRRSEVRRRKGGGI